MLYVFIKSFLNYTVTGSVNLYVLQRFINPYEIIQGFPISKPMEATCRLATGLHAVHTPPPHCSMCLWPPPTSLPCRGPIASPLPLIHPYLMVLSQCPCRCPLGWRQEAAARGRRGSLECPAAVAAGAMQGVVGRQEPGQQGGEAGGYNLSLHRPHVALRPPVRQPRNSTCYILHIQTFLVFYSLFSTILIFLKPLVFCLLSAWQTHAPVSIVFQGLSHHK